MRPNRRNADKFKPNLTSDKYAIQHNHLLTTQFVHTQFNSFIAGNGHKICVIMIDNCEDLMTGSLAAETERLESTMTGCQTLDAI